MGSNLLKPDYLFETSWEVCNKVGGIYTVIATKALSIVNEYKDNYILFGPDLIWYEDENPEFSHDPELYKDWRLHAEASGLRIKIGRWKIKGEPIVVLLDFSSFINQKDKIFSELWEVYKLDSLSGQWDYIEPTLFGYAVGQVIENFIKFNLKSSDKVVAQFHEWMTGSGILYLEKRIPQVATVFTTHATAVGRSLAGNNRPLYKDLKKYNAEEIAKEFNIISKQSIEKISAQIADVFTTVSEITSKECQQFLKKKVDIITPNGFEDLIIPGKKEYDEKRKIARKKLIKVANTLLDEEITDDAFIIATSGRYEFKNKGLDLYIDAISELAKSKELNRPVIAFLLIPANHYGARKDLLSKLEDNNQKIEGSKFMTHNLHNADWDPILNRIYNGELKNDKNSKVKIIYVPSYLNGNDGLFDLPYYDVLIGCDLSVFVSYYEPWGYTPLESIAFSIPTITTTLAGFGMWIKNECADHDKAVTIIHRTDDNDKSVVKNVYDTILSLYKLGTDEYQVIREKAFKISQSVLWRSLFSYYQKAYDIALKKTEERSDQFIELLEKPTERIYEEIIPLSNEPKWSRIIVKSKLPDTLLNLYRLSENIWWTWDDEAQELFETIDPSVWKASEYNPLVLFEQVPYEKLITLSKDKNYINKLNSVYGRFSAYLNDIIPKGQPKIAYFSMEYGFHDCLKLYSGGLGILAGDYLKEASDSKYDIIGVGLLYRFGYFKQILTVNGEQQAYYDFQHFSKTPIHPIRDKNGDFLTISIMLPGHILHARIWEVHVGRIKLILLDTDFEGNEETDRDITHKLYGGDNENRLKQEMLLGVGGIRALALLGITPDLYHSNEGHSAFIGLERMRNFMSAENLSFEEAKEIVRATTLFTTHTPVPAGHDQFEEDLIRKYMGHYPDRLKLNWENFMAMGRTNPNDWKEKFNMSHLAAHLAQEVNGVSMLHGAVTREMFAKLWPGYLPEELHIKHVTNGVHFSTWTAKEWKVIYNEILDGDINLNLANKEKWKNIYNIPDSRIWDIKQQLRSKLIKSVKERFKENWIKRHEEPKQIIAINDILSENTLTVVFARRFATYKRAHLLFRNFERLSKLLNKPDKPVQFIFAGKAHPNDKAGQDLIKMVVDISKRPDFLGKILFLQNYSISLAKLLVQGADVWLNTPTRPLEASGTSGEKAVMNGTLHFSVLDGWWVEGYQPEAGWALTNERTYDNQSFQDDLDAEIIYSLFENEIIPSFYKRDKDGIPTSWISYIKNTIANISPKFTTRRMITDYDEKFYSKQFKRSKELLKNDFDLILKIADWKKRMLMDWNDIRVLDVQLYDKKTEVLETGTTYKGKVILDLNNISQDNVGVEFIVTENAEKIIAVKQFTFKGMKNDTAVYEAEILLDYPGTFTYGIRVFPKNSLLPHRQDFGLLKWI